MFRIKIQALFEHFLFIFLKPERLRYKQCLTFCALSKNCEKLPLASSYLSVLPRGTTRLHWEDFHEF
jgi:hypothetical protein